MRVLPCVAFRLAESCRRQHCSSAAQMCGEFHAEPNTRAASPALPCNSTRGGREQRLSGATCKKPARGEPVCGGACLRRSLSAEEPVCGGAACGEPACARQGRSRLNAEHCGCSAIQPGKATAGSAAVSGAAPSSLLSGPLPFAWFTLTAIVECAKLLGDHQEAVLIES